MEIVKYVPFAYFHFHLPYDCNLNALSVHNSLWISRILIIQIHDEIINVNQENYFDIYLIDIIVIIILFQ